MATSVDFIEYVCEQIHGAYSVRYKKMFGEYLVYVNDKPIFTVCDNCVYVKIIVQIENIMKDAEIGKPYDGAKDHYILDIDNSELVDQLVPILEQITPLPRRKK